MTSPVEFSTGEFRANQEKMSKGLLESLRKRVPAYYGHYGMAFPPQPIQGSYRFLDPKFKTFSSLFSKTIIYFSRLKVIKKVIERSLGEVQGGHNLPLPIPRSPASCTFCPFVSRLQPFSNTDETLTRLTQSTHVYMCHVMTRMM